MLKRHCSGRSQRSLSFCLQRDCDAVSELNPFLKERYVAFAAGRKCSVRSYSDPKLKGAAVVFDRSLEHCVDDDSYSDKRELLLTAVYNHS